MDDSLQLVGLFLLGLALLVVMAVALTWEPKGARRVLTCPYCVAVAWGAPPPAHCWRCGGRYDRGLYSTNWDAMDLELFRSYHGRNPDGFTGAPDRPPTPGRRPGPPDEGYQEDRHE